MNVPAVRDVMTKNPITIDASADVSTAAELMKEKHIRHLPVVKNGKVLSVLSYQQVKTISEMYGSLGPRTSLHCGDLQDSNPFHVTTPDAPIDQVCREMAATKTTSAIVTSGQGVEGIFTVVDACLFISESFSK